MFHSWFSNVLAWEPVYCTDRGDKLHMARYSSRADNDDLPLAPFGFSCHSGHQGELLPVRGK